MISRHLYESQCLNGPRVGEFPYEVTGWSPFALIQVPKEISRAKKKKFQANKAYVNHVAMAKMKYGRKSAAF